jgi:hypothetical protein
LADEELGSKVVEVRTVHLGGRQFLYIQARHRVLMETWAQAQDRTPPDGGTVPLIGAPTDTDPSQ